MVRTSFILYRDSIPPRRPFICSTFAKNVKKGTLKNVSNMEDATSQFHDQDLLQICGFLEIIGVTKFYSNAITFKALMSNSCNKVIKPQKFNQMRVFLLFLRNKIFVQKSGHITFVPLWYPNCVQKI